MISIELNTAYKKGDIVKLKSEFCSSQEQRLEFEILNLNEVTNRILIRVTKEFSTMSFDSIELVGEWMVYPAK